MSITYDYVPDDSGRIGFKCFNNKFLCLNMSLIREIFLKVYLKNQRSDLNLLILDNNLTIVSFVTVLF